MTARPIARIGVAWAVALLALTAFGPPAAAAGMPPYGTKNFTPAPATPAYFTGAPDTLSAGPRAAARPAATGWRMPHRRRRLKAAHLYRARATRPVHARARHRPLRRR